MQMESKLQDWKNSRKKSNPVSKVEQVLPAGSAQIMVGWKGWISEDCLDRNSDEERIIPGCVDHPAEGRFKKKNMKVKVEFFKS